MLSAVYAFVVCPSVCVCVCVSVTLRYCIKTAKRRITQITPHNSPLTLVFWHLSIKWWCFRWPWVTPNPPNHPNFAFFRILIETMRLSCTGFELLSLNSQNLTSGSAMAEGLRDAPVSRNSATTKHPIWKLESRAYRVALFAWSYV